MWILVGSMGMNCFPSTTILSFHRRIIFSGVRHPFQIIRGQGLPECISPQQTVWDTPKYFPHVVRFELKIAVPLLLTKEKCNATFDSRLRISIEEAVGACENRLQEGRSDDIFCHSLRFMMMKICFPRLIAHLKSKSTSPIVFQIHFQNQFP